MKGARGSQAIFLFKNLNCFDCLKIFLSNLLLDNKNQKYNFWRPLNRKKYILPILHQIFYQACLRSTNWSIWMKERALYLLIAHLSCTNNLFCYKEIHTIDWYYKWIIFDVIFFIDEKKLIPSNLLTKLGVFSLQPLISNQLSIYFIFLRVNRSTLYVQLYILINISYI